jgi:hypothetical protein
LEREETGLDLKQEAMQILNLPKKEEMENVFKIAKVHT